MLVDVTELRSGDSFQYLGIRLTCRGVSRVPLPRRSSNVFQEYRVDTEERGPIQVFVGTSFLINPPDGNATPLEQAVLQCAPLMGQQTRDRVSQIAEGGADVTHIDHALEEVGLVDIITFRESATVGLTSLGTTLHRIFTEETS